LRLIAWCASDPLLEIRNLLEVISVVIQLRAHWLRSAKFRSSRLHDALYLRRLKALIEAGDSRTLKDRPWPPLCGKVAALDLDPEPGAGRRREYKDVLTQKEDRMQASLLAGRGKNERGIMLRTRRLEPV